MERITFYYGLYGFCIHTFIKMLRIYYNIESVAWINIFIVWINIGTFFINIIKFKKMTPLKEKQWNEKKKSKLFTQNKATLLFWVDLISMPEERKTVDPFKFLFTPSRPVINTSSLKQLENSDTHRLDTFTWIWDHNKTELSAYQLCMFTCQEAICVKHNRLIIFYIVIIF